MRTVAIFDLVFKAGIVLSILGGIIGVSFAGPNAELAVFIPVYFSGICVAIFALASFVMSTILNIMVLNHPDKI